MPIDVWSKFGEECYPVRATEDSAGYDIRTPVDIILPPDCTMVIDTGLVFDASKLSWPLHYKLVPRSSAGIKKNIQLMNTVGIIDKDYNGPEDTLKVAIWHRPMTRWRHVKTYKHSEIIDEHLWNREKYKVHHDPQTNRFHIYEFDEDYNERCRDTPVVLYRAGERFMQLLIEEQWNKPLRKVDKIVNSNRGMNSTGDE